MPKAARLREMLKDAGVKPGKEYSFPHLYEKVPGIGAGELAKALERLQEQGFVTKVFRVMSPTEDGGIEDYESLSEVPERVYDWHAEREIDVSLDDLEVIIKVHRL